MGLDCYVNVKTANAAGEEEVNKIWYGRKENEIHGWMQRQSEVSPDDFNCVDLPLTEELIDLLEADLEEGKLVPTGGFFFGQANEAVDVNDAATSLIIAARAALNDGQAPYYTSWW